MTTPLVGTIQPVLADIMGRVTWFPFLIGLWSDQWPWGSLIILVYHFMVYLPLRQIYPALIAAQTFPSLEDDATSRQMYMIIMPSVAAGACMLGAVTRRFLRVPFHLVPMGHLIRNLWPLSQFTPSAYASTNGLLQDSRPAPTPPPPFSDRYAIYATVAFILSVGGSMASQEIYAWVHGGGDAIWDWVLAFIPVVAAILAFIPSFFFEPRETYALYGLGPHVRMRSVIAAAKVVGCTLLVTAVPQIVALYKRNMNVVLLSGSMMILGVVIIAFALSRTLFADTPEMYRTPVMSKSAPTRALY